eukprot:TRINITY_DN11644_c0_g1_i1.p1 TRINITY_DN11644_c0_g1~~TRINITY_DN11644_c0_g1_i1.p1  ORF type:complete len:459 (+),score=85.01 TRINITY_DN11644_c0_g1_i1:41-1417(+)
MSLFDPTKHLFVYEKLNVLHSFNNWKYDCFNKKCDDHFYSLMFGNHYHPRTGSITPIFDMKPLKNGEKFFVLHNNGTHSLFDETQGSCLNWFQNDRIPPFSTFIHTDNNNKIYFGPNFGYLNIDTGHLSTPFKIDKLRSLENAVHSKEIYLLSDNCLYLYDRRSSSSTVKKPMKFLECKLRNFSFKKISKVESKSNIFFLISQTKYKDDKDKVHTKTVISTHDHRKLSSKCSKPLVVQSIELPFEVKNIFPRSNNELAFVTENIRYGTLSFVERDLHLLTEPWRDPNSYRQRVATMTNYHIENQIGFFNREYHEVSRGLPNSEFAGCWSANKQLFLCPSPKGVFVFKFNSILHNVECRLLNFRIPSIGITRIKDGYVMACNDSSLIRIFNGSLDTDHDEIDIIKLNTEDFFDLKENGSHFLQIPNQSSLQNLLEQGKKNQQSRNALKFGLKYKRSPSI